MQENSSIKLKDHFISAKSNVTNKLAMMAHIYKASNSGAWGRSIAECSTQPELPTKCHSVVCRVWMVENHTNRRGMDCFIER